MRLASLAGLALISHSLAILNNVLPNSLGGGIEVLSLSFACGQLARCMQTVSCWRMYGTIGVRDHLIHVVNLHSRIFNRTHARA
jgi:hypothetical protein